jgi:hypothetical protein
MTKPSEPFHMKQVFSEVVAREEMDREQQISELRKSAEHETQLKCRNGFYYANDYWDSQDSLTEGVLIGEAQASEKALSVIESQQEEITKLKAAEEETDKLKEIISTLQAQRASLAPQIQNLGKRYDESLQVRAALEREITNLKQKN